MDNAGKRHTQPIIHKYKKKSEKIPKNVQFKTDQNNDIVKEIFYFAKYDQWFDPFYEVIELNFLNKQKRVPIYTKPNYNYFPIYSILWKLLSISALIPNVQIIIL